MLFRSVDVLDDLFTISYLICINILKHLKIKIERVPTGNRGQLVKIAHLEFGGNELVHQSWCFFKTLGLCNCATS